VEGDKMFSKDILSEVKKEGGLQRKKSQVELNQEAMDKKVSSIIAGNKFIEDSILHIKEQIKKGKDYKFVLNRDKDGLIKEIVAVPVEAV
jgi:hypothetical protein